MTVDAEFFERFKPYQSRIKARARLRARSGPRCLDADDYMQVAQLACYVAWSKRTEEPHDWEAFFNTYARNAMVDLIRDNAWTKRSGDTEHRTMDHVELIVDMDGEYVTEADELTPDRYLESRELVVCLMQALRNKPRHTRCVQLTAQGWRQHEIAEDLGVTGPRIHQLFEEIRDVARRIMK